MLLYGHLDKQPEMIGWRDGFGPWDPLYENGRLYGRGSADDGYAVFAAFAAIGALQAQGIAHSRCVGMIETCEESGSYDLPAYLDALAPRMGAVDFVVGLDSGCGDYERLWATTSLRGLAGGKLTVKVLTEGVHSGDASGVVPSSFRIARRLLDRIEDSATGRVIGPEFHAAIPAERVEQARRAAEILGDIVIRKYPFADGTQSMIADRAEALLNRTWRPALSVTGADGLPPIADAGNVLRPQTSFKLSLRLPPPIDGDVASRHLKKCSRPILRTARQYASKASPTRRGGTHRRRRRGSTGRSTTLPRSATASPRLRWAKAGRSRSWLCWESTSPTRSF